MYQWLALVKKKCSKSVLVLLLKLMCYCIPFETAACSVLNKHRMQRGFMGGEFLTKVKGDSKPIKFRFSVDDTLAVSVFVNVQILYVDIPCKQVGTFI